MKISHSTQICFFLRVIFHVVTFSSISSLSAWEVIIDKSTGKPWLIVIPVNEQEKQIVEMLYDSNFLLGKVTVFYGGGYKTGYTLNGSVEAGVDLSVPPPSVSISCPDSIIPGQMWGVGWIELNGQPVFVVFPASSQDDNLIQQWQMDNTVVSMPYTNNQTGNLKGYVANQDWNVNISEGRTENDLLGAEAAGWADSFQSQWAQEWADTGEMPVMPLNPSSNAPVSEGRTENDLLGAEAAGWADSSQSQWTDEWTDTGEMPVMPLKYSFDVSGGCCKGDGSNICWDLLTHGNCRRNYGSNVCQFDHFDKRLMQYVVMQARSKNTREVCQDQDDHNQENCKKIHTKKNKCSNEKSE